ncbi:hypothetical protein LSTR_LSTR001756, partial [Laodelphax striatellus]
MLATSVRSAPLGLQVRRVYVVTPTLLFRLTSARTHTHTDPRPLTTIEMPNHLRPSEVAALPLRVS